MNPLARVPILNNIFFRLIGYKTLIKEVPESFYRPDKFLDYKEKYAVQMKYKGFARAILSSLRHFPLEGFSDVYRRVGKLEIPIQVFWGKQDNVLPFSMSAMVKKELGARIHEIEECGHMPQYESPDVVNPKLIEFLSPK